MKTLVAILPLPVLLAACAADRPPVIDFDDPGFTEAVRHFQAALQLNPESAAAHNNMGNVLSALGQSHEAARHYRQAIKIRPTYAEAHNNLGSVIGSQGDLDGAIELFSRAVQLDPDYDEAARNLNKALEARDQTRP